MEQSIRRKTTSYQSATSMLNFMNRAGRSLPEGQREVLERSKEELRSLFKHTKKQETSIGRADNALYHLHPTHSRVLETHQLG